MSEQGLDTKVRLVMVEGHRVGVCRGRFESSPEPLGQVNRMNLAGHGRLRSGSHKPVGSVALGVKL